MPNRIMDWANIDDDLCRAAHVRRDDSETRQVLTLAAHLLEAATQERPDDRAAANAVANALRRFAQMDGMGVRHGE